MGVRERPSPEAPEILSRLDAWLSRILQWSPPARAGVSAALTLVALLARLGLIDRLGDHFIYAAFYPALLVSALLCGAWGGIVAFLSILTLTHVPLLGRQISSLAAPADTVAIVFFAFNGGMILALAHALRALLRAHGMLDDFAREHAEELGHFVEQAPVAMAMFDRDMRYLAASARWRDEHGLNPDIVGKSHYDTYMYVSDEWKSVHARALAGETVRCDKDRLRIDDGKTRFLRWEVRPWLHSRGGIGGVLIFSEDITERVRIREALKNNERRLKAILDAAMEAIVTTDSGGRIIAANPAASEIFGYAADELLGRDVKLLMPAPHRAGHDTYIANYHRTHKTNVVGKRRELEGRHKDGTVFPLELTVSEAQDNGGTIFVGLMRDLSPIEAERRRVNALRDELIHVSRLNDMGEVVAGLAHEVGQPVAAILNFAAAHRRASAPGGPGPEPELIARIETQARRAGEILKRLRSFIEKRPAEREVVSVGVLVSEALKLAPPRSLAQIIVASEPDGEINVCVDRIQVEQVLINLLRNADEAVRNWQAPQIRVAVSQTDAGDVRVSVADNGPGVEPEARDKLFSAFYSTKRLGMGVGLAICKSIVESHGGEICFRQNSPQGAIFEFVLPVFRPRTSADAPV
jgi:two-component system sensor kinase FixL